MVTAVVAGAGRVWLATRREGLDDDDHAAAAAAVRRHPMPLQAQLFVIYSRKQMGIDFWEQIGYISFFATPRHKSMKPSVLVQIDPDDEILEGDSVFQRVGNYLPDSRWRKRYRPTDWPVLKLWRRSAVAALPWECQSKSKPVASSGARSDGRQISSNNSTCC